MSTLYPGNRTKHGGWPNGVYRKLELEANWLLVGWSVAEKWSTNVMGGVGLMGGLEGPVARRGGRATRDGRRPLLSQQQLAAWFEVAQPHISGHRRKVDPSPGQGVPGQWSVERSQTPIDQHHQHFCGFDSLETARLYLAIFEKVYRFTPFTQDAQPRIRGKCPLEVAGYDVSELPMAQICRGWTLAWPVTTQPGGVPNG